MNRNLIGILLPMGVLIAATGCNMRLKGAADVNSTVDSFAATAWKETEFAQARDATRTAASVPLPLPTNTVEPTITLTPTVTQTPTPEKVAVQVTKNTNCRTGPDKIFDLVGIMKVGETAEAIGRNAAKTYWVIKLPANTAKTCWLWYEWATVTGNGDALPIVESPPTPTWSPKPDFTFSYVGKVNCPMANMIKLQIVNTGNVAWESYRIETRDLTTDLMGVSVSSEFPGFPACGWSNPSALQPGETGFAVGLSPTGSAGHSVEVILHLFTGNGTSGTHMKGNFTFTMT
jgi:hypothetical protein